MSQPPIKLDVYLCWQICYALCNHKKMHHIQVVPTVNLLIILTQVYTLGTIHDALLNKNSLAYKRKHKNVYKLAIQLSAPYSY